jgi:DNA primase
MSTNDFKETVRQQADIVRIVGDYVKLKKSGAQNYSGLCPFHQEKTPSFSVHATRQFFHCFGCGASGDVFTFVQKIENITFPEAVRAIAQKLGIPLPKTTYSGPAEAREASLRGKLLDIHAAATEFFEEQLRKPEGARAREYLAGRGLTDETIRTFRIGFAPDSGFLLRDRLRGRFDEEALRESGLFSWKETGSATHRPIGSSENAGAMADEPMNRSSDVQMYSKFRARVMFPIANDQGKVIAFTGRSLASDEKMGPKYLNSPETAIYSKSRVLYNLDRAKEAVRKLDYSILVEGQMDCISVFAAGLHNVIASSGTAFTEAQVKLLARFSKKIVVNFDPDAAGARAAERSLALLVAEDFEIKVLTLEAGLDPDLFIRQRGRDAYGAALRAAPKYFDYLIERARAQFPKTPEGKHKAINYLLPHLQHVPSPIVRSELANEIAQKIGVDSPTLKQELKHAAAVRQTAVKAPAEPQVTQAERVLIRALATDDPDTKEDLHTQVRFDLRSEGLHQGLAAESLLEILLANEVPDPMALELSDPDRRLLAWVLMKEDEPLTPELLHGALEALRHRKLERECQHLRAAIAEAERRNDSAALADLMQQKLRLDRELATH